MYRIIHIIIYLFTVKTQLCPTFGGKYPETRSTNIVGFFLNCFYSDLNDHNIRCSIFSHC